MASDSSMRLPEPMCVDDFKWGKRIGRGAFSEVFVVRHRATGDDYSYAAKVIRKKDILERRQVNHILEERIIAFNILNDKSHQSIAQYVGAFHDERCVYLVMEFVCGGDLFSHLRRLVRFKKRTVEFYAAQALNVLDYLHSLGIVYRDLKPENILLDRRGYLKLVDFGISKRVAKGQRTYTVCGSPEYMAPEVVLSKGHSYGVDWWSLGVLIYEMIVGQPPFVSRNIMNVYKLIIRAKPRFPARNLRVVDADTKRIIKRLLKFDETRRLGVCHGKTAKMRAHNFFHGMDWDQLRSRKLGRMEGSIVPAVESAQDTSQFPTVARQSASESSSNGSSSKKKKTKSTGGGGGSKYDEKSASLKTDKKSFPDQIKSESIPRVPEPDPFEAFD